MALVDHVLEQTIRYFGPVPMGLLEHLDDDDSCAKLIEISNRLLAGGHLRPFSKWPDSHWLHLNPIFKSFVGRMLTLDPAKRATVAELLKDPWWDQKE